MDLKIVIKIWETKKSLITAGIFPLNFLLIDRTLKAKQLFYS